jgi:hypothetical protein
MRGRSQDQSGMFSYIHPEKRIPAYHPLRKIRELVREVLKELPIRSGGSTRTKADRRSRPSSC